MPRKKIQRRVAKKTISSRKISGLPRKRKRKRINKMTLKRLKLGLRKFVKKKSGVLKKIFLTSKNKTVLVPRSRWAISILLILALVASQVFAVFAFESHTVNVVATICDYSETRPADYWKEYQDKYMYYLPLTLAGEEIYTIDRADEILGMSQNANTKDMVRAGLLALKFNIVAWGIGDYVPSNTNENLAKIAVDADNLLLNSNATTEELLYTKNLLDSLNYLPQLKFCANPPLINKHLVINKVYYNVDKDHGAKHGNEWVEIYNPKDEPVDIGGFTLFNSMEEDVLASTYFIPAKGFALVTGNDSTWDYWDIPDDVTKIVLPDGDIGSGLSNKWDILGIKDSDGIIIDQLNWGPPDPSWKNYNDKVWNPAIIPVTEGHILGRIPTGFDIDRTTDFKDFMLPAVTVLSPDGGEIWWIGRTNPILWRATNPNGKDSDLKIDIWYSGDSGKTWATIARNVENDGVYDWRIPLMLGGYDVYSETARIKILARGPENFMIQGVDRSNNDFCPPIDFSLLTDEERAAVESMEETGFIDTDKIINRPISELAASNYVNVQEEKIVDGDNEDSNVSPYMENNNVNEKTLEPENMPLALPGAKTLDNILGAIRKMGDSAQSTPSPGPSMKPPVVEKEEKNINTDSENSEQNNDPRENADDPKNNDDDEDNNSGEEINIELDGEPYFGISQYKRSTDSIFPIQVFTEDNSLVPNGNRADNIK